MFYALLIGAALLQNGTIHGTVRAEGSREPLPHATVTVAGRSALADQAGYFVIRGVPDGRWRAEASAIGYSLHALTVVMSGGTVHLDFELAVRPVAMPALEVNTRPVDAVDPGASATLHPGPAAVRVQNSALRTVPGLAEPDVLRALQMLPSVAAMSDYSSALYVRGGSADQSEITLDGFPLFNPYHVGGIFSAIPMDAVASVDLWPGALPAGAGDRLAGAVNVHSRAGGRDRMRASGALGLISSHLTLDGPVGSGTLLFSGRRTYLDAISRAAYSLKMIDTTIPYGFSDAYARATFPVGTLGSLSISGYLDREGVRVPKRMRDELNATAGFDWGSRMIGMTYRQPFGGHLLLQARLGYSDFHGDFDAWEMTEYTEYDCGDFTVPCKPLYSVHDTSQVVAASTLTRDIVAAADLTWYHRNHTLRGGVQLDAYRLRHRLSQLQDVDDHIFPLFDMTDSPRTFAAWVEDEWSWGDRLTGRAGMRVLHAGRTGSALLPRVGVKLQATPRLALTAGGGAYAQVLRSMRNDESVVSSFIAYDLITAQPASVGLARGVDAVIGAAFTDVHTSVRADAYVKRMRNLVLPTRTPDPMDAMTVVVDSFAVGTGTASGIELSVSQRLGSAELGLAYALSFASRTSPAGTYTPRFERRHMLDANASVRPSARSLLSARLAVGSGQPYTPVTGTHAPALFDPATGEWLMLAPTLLLGDYNAGRLPGYLRLDVAARRSHTRRWFGRETTVTPYLQIVNVLGSRNALIAEPRPYDGPHVSYWPQLPFLPTFGLEWRF